MYLQATAARGVVLLRGVLVGARLRGHRAHPHAPPPGLRPRRPQARRLRLRLHLHPRLPSPHPTGLCLRRGSARPQVTYARSRGTDADAPAQGGPRGLRGLRHRHESKVGRGRGNGQRDGGGLARVRANAGDTGAQREAGRKGCEQYLPTMPGVHRMPTPSKIQCRRQGSPASECWRRRRRGAG